MIRSLPRGAQVFIACILAIGAPIAGLAVAGVVRLAETGALAPSVWIQAAIVAAVIAALSQWRIPLPSNGKYSVSTIGHIIGLIVFPLPLALAVTGVGWLLGDLYSRATPIKSAFNVSTILITVGMAGGVLSLLGGGGVLFSSASAGPLTLVAIVLLCLLYYAVNVSVFTAFQSLISRRGLVYTFRVNHSKAMLPELLAVVVGVIGGILCRFYGPLAILTAGPAMLAHVSYHSIRRLQWETVRAVTELANSIDVRDPYTAKHSERVAALSRRLAVALKLEDDKVEQIYLAASVHDVGKMTVPVEILDKPGALSPAERAIIEQHPVTGAEVLKHYKGFAPSLPSVLHHHERWDGRGYPHGIAGAAIPLGGRIIALADTFDAMTSDRPYRRGMPGAEALRRIAEGAGSQFDPHLAPLFVAMLREEHPPQSAEDTGRIVVFPPVGPGSRQPGQGELQATGSP